VSLPRIALTVGDPAGIGPEIAAKAARDPRVLEVCEPIVYDTPPDLTIVPGLLSADGGRAAYDVIVRATADAMAGRVDAVTTAPVNKEAFALAGLPWRGHTLLATTDTPFTGDPATVGVSESDIDAPPQRPKAP
jgi:4-hydroxythreonine-4-phosphate dehydrogenase